MDEATRAKIFDPFFTTKFTGRGLGLAAVSGIMRGHKGVIRVDSTLGNGTTLRAYFPATATTLVKQEKEQSLVAVASSSRTILVVDDEEIVRRVAKKTLERHGHRLLLAENGQEAVDAFRKAPDEIAVVLLDMTMLVMSGDEALAQLKTIQPDVRVILSSGFNEVEATRRFKGQGLAGFLQKPYTAALVQKVNEVLQDERSFRAH